MITVSECEVGRGCSCRNKQEMLSALKGFSPENYCMYIVLRRLVILTGWTLTWS